jgi:hypothetical protein
MSCIEALQTIPPYLSKRYTPIQKMEKASEHVRSACEDVEKLNK